MPRAWSDKRERQYEHIKDSALERGESEDTAEEIAARTVNKERARAGEAKESSRTSTDDIGARTRMAEVVTGGGPVFPDIVQRMVETWPAARVTSVYGSTEAEPIAHVTTDERTERDLAAMRAGGTRDQLYNEARHKGVKGRSKMNKAELERAVGR